MDPTEPPEKSPRDCELEGVSFSQMQATQENRTERPAWSLRIQTSLGHASGRLPSHRDDCWQAWHWPGQAIPQEDLISSLTCAVVINYDLNLKFYFCF